MCYVWWSGLGWFAFGKLLGAVFFMVVIGPWSQLAMVRKPVFVLRLLSLSFSFLQPGIDPPDGLCWTCWDGWDERRAAGGYHEWWWQVLSVVVLLYPTRLIVFCCLLEGCFLLLLLHFFRCVYFAYRWGRLAVPVYAIGGGNMVRELRYFSLLLLPKWIRFRTGLVWL